MAAKPQKKLNTAERFGVAGVAACLTTCCVHPMDVIRIRMQLDSEGGGTRLFRNPWHCATALFKADGVKGLFAGLGAGIFRQLAYGTPRMALYTIGLGKLSDADVKPNMAQKMALGSVSGATAALGSVPADVVMVRMAADAKAPADQRRNYTGVGNALLRVYKEEGLAALWSGTAPTLARAVLLNGGQLGCYSEAKERLTPLLPVTFLWGIPLQFTSGLVAATAATALSCPADVLKSRVQNSRPGQYFGMLDCAGKLLKHEGVFALWKGAGPSVMKLAPHSVISLLLIDNITFFLTGAQAL